MDSTGGLTPCRVRGCPIRRSSDHCVVSTPRRFSQLPTSFFGTRRQGIHRMPVALLLPLSPDWPASRWPPAAPHLHLHLRSRRRNAAATRQRTRRVLASVVKVQLLISTETRIQHAPPLRNQLPCHLHATATRPSSLGAALQYTSFLLDFAVRRQGWRCGESNPVPPACKAGALPDELHPRWWGILDSNQGPQSYQDCALTT